MIIANAMDDAPPDVRRAGVELELTALADLGFGAVELGLACATTSPSSSVCGTRHPETAAIELVVARYRAAGIAYRTLHDGQALLINDPETGTV